MRTKYGFLVLSAALSAPLCGCIDDDVSERTAALEAASDTACGDAATLARWAPAVHLHPYDHHRPQSLDELLDRGVVVDSAGALVGTVAELDLADASPSWQIVHEAFRDEGYPSGIYGRPETGARASGGEVRAPVYVKALAYPDAGVVDLVYMFYYEFNASQIFRGGFGWFSTRKRNFPLPQFGRHEGDWEHVTVRLDAGSCDMLGAFYARHGESVWHDRGQLRFEDGDHPVVYSALNGHGSFAAPGSYVLEEIPDVVINRIVGVQWLKLIDEVSHTPREAEEHGTRVYALPSDYADEVVWRSWTEVVDVDRPGPEHARVGELLAFPGRFGVAGLDNSEVQRPPGLPYGGDARVLDLARLAVDLGVLDDELLSGNGPLSPAAQTGGYWSGREAP